MPSSAGEVIVGYTPGGQAIYRQDQSRLTAPQNIVAGGPPTAGGAGGMQVGGPRPGDPPAPGYELVYSPNGGAYWARTPTSAGERANQYTSAAMGGSLDALRSAAGMFGFGGGGGMMGAGAGGGGVMGGGGGIAAGSNIPGVAPIDMTASNAATFGRAKDTAGQIGRSSLEALRGALGETGQLGGGAETQATRDIIESAAGQIGNINREQAIQNATQGLDIAKANYLGGITQRGQNIAAQEAQARLAQEYAQMQFQQVQLQSQRQLEMLKLALGSMPKSPAGLY